MESLQLLAQLLHLIILLTDPITVGLVLGNQVLQLAFLVAELQIGIHALLQGFFNLLLHLDFFKLLRLDSVLQFLISGRKHCHLLGVLLQLGQLQLQRLVVVSVAASLLRHIRHVSMDLEKKAKLLVEECENG